jgi:hypothetical protein
VKNNVGESLEGGGRDLLDFGARIEYCNIKQQTTLSYRSGIKTTNYPINYDMQQLMYNCFHTSPPFFRSLPPLLAFTRTDRGCVVTLFEISGMQVALTREK